MERIQDELERREERRHTRRSELEEQEFATCTFAPETRQYHEAHEPVLVNGLGRFFELRSMALRQKEEKEQREAKAPCAESVYARCGGLTIPEPFDLSVGPFRS